MAVSGSLAGSGARARAVRRMRLAAEVVDAKAEPDRDPAAWLSERLPAFGRELDEDRLEQAAGCRAGRR